MSYQTITWVNRDKDKNVAGTKLNAENMNRIEGGIQALDNALSTLSKQITPEQLALLANVSKSLETLKTVQDELELLKKNFATHVHSNEAGNTTGAVIIETSSPTTGA